MRQPYDQVNYDELTVGGVLVREMESRLETIARDLYWGLVYAVGIPYMISEFVENYKKVKEVQGRANQRIKQPIIENIEKIGVVLGVLTYPIQLGEAIYLSDKGAWGLCYPLLFVSSNIYSLVKSRQNKK